MPNRFVFPLYIARRTPFELRFLSDNYEFATESMTTNTGFQLSYILSSSNC